MKIKLTIAPLVLAALLSCQNPTGKPVQQKELTETTHLKKTIMNNKDYTTQIVVKKDPQTAFEAIQNFRGWWSEEIQGQSDVLNESFFYHYKDVHLCKLKLIEKNPGQKLVYLVLDNQFNFVKDKTEWIGTKLIFELMPEGEQTKIVFTHEGLVPEYECYKVCHDAWTGYIQGSLKNFIETGKGKPNGKEGGLNAELVKKWGLPDK
ncbi:SRPBCC family protein [Pedobacter roseus]|nr:SRPBCC domain-containing protein [Pedobacter roseus]